MSDSFYRFFVILLYNELVYRFYLILPSLLSIYSRSSTDTPTYANTQPCRIPRSTAFALPFSTI